MRLALLIAGVVFTWIIVGVVLAEWVAAVLDGEPYEDYERGMLNG